jgi:transposase
MPLRPEAEWAIPEETRRVATAIFSKGNSVIRIRDEFGELYADDQFEALFPRRGQPAESPGRLAWVTVLQFAEGLTDRQAAEAVRRCIDWKYALCDPSLERSGLCDNRSFRLRAQPTAT